MVVYVQNMIRKVRKKASGQILYLLFKISVFKYHTSYIPCYQETFLLT